MEIYAAVLTRRNLAIVSSPSIEAFYSAVTIGKTLRRITASLSCKQSALSVLKYMYVNCKRRNDIKTESVYDCLVERTDNIRVKSKYPKMNAVQLCYSSLNRLTEYLCNEAALTLFGRNQWPLKRNKRSTFIQSRRKINTTYL